MWIETANASVLWSVNASVAPHRGVWIETLKVEGDVSKTVSRPIGACGLKPYGMNLKAHLKESRPIGACGLKP